MTCRYRLGWRPSSGITELLFFRPLQLFMKTVVPYGSVSYLQFESFLLELLLLFQKSLSSLAHLFHFLPERRVTYIIDADYFSMCFFSLSSIWNTPFFFTTKVRITGKSFKEEPFHVRIPSPLLDFLHSLQQRAKTLFLLQLQM